MLQTQCDCRESCAPSQSLLPSRLPHSWAAAHVSRLRHQRRSSSSSRSRRRPARRSGKGAQASRQNAIFSVASDFPSFTVGSLRRLQFPQLHAIMTCLHVTGATMTWVFLVNPAPRKGRRRQPTAADARAMLESLGLSVVDCPSGCWPPATPLDHRLGSPTDVTRVGMVTELAVASFAYWSRVWSTVRSRWRPRLQIEQGPWLIRRGLQCRYGTVELPMPANDLSGR